jgi:hypothetical protein
MALLWFLFAVSFALGCACSIYFQERTVSLGTRAHYVAGFLVAIDYLVFWAFPFAFMGGIYKELLIPYLYPTWQRIDQSEVLRSFAEKYIYEKPRCADYFATQFLFLLQLVVQVGVMFAWQVAYGSLPWWLIAAYNLAWVGMGGRAVGAAYAVSHREGHDPKFYKAWIRKSVGNVFENWVGLFYGGVASNFTTTHLSIHHRLDAGIGDTLYCWDFDRSSWVGFMPYLCRGFFHMTGFTGLYQFLSSQRHYDRVNANRLARGVFCYWFVWPFALYLVTKSFSFYFFVVLQPLFAMSFFIALINMGFHSCIESDEQGRRINCVESTTFIAGLDDTFGEDDHMAHHYHGYVYFKDLDNHQKKQWDEWAKYKASVFQGFDIFTFSIMVLLKAWPILAARFIDFSGELSQTDIAEMLEKRMSRREMEHYCLLPGMPGQKARGYLNAPPPDSNDIGSEQYQNVVHRLAKFQLWLATQMEKGLPPIEPGLTSWACKPVDGTDRDVPMKDFEEVLARLQQRATQPHLIQKKAA